MPREGEEEVQSNSKFSQVGNQNQPSDTPWCPFVSLGAIF